MTDFHVFKIPRVLPVVLKIWKSVCKHMLAHISHNKYENRNYHPPSPKIWDEKIMNISYNKVHVDGANCTLTRGMVWFSA